MHPEVSEPIIKGKKSLNISSHLCEEIEAEQKNKQKKKKNLYVNN